MEPDFTIIIEHDGTLDVAAIQKEVDRVIDDVLEEKLDCDARFVRRGYPSLFAYWGGTVALLDDVLGVVARMRL
jgi:hypothetical protein